MYWLQLTGMAERLDMQGYLAQLNVASPFLRAAARYVGAFLAVAVAVYVAAWLDPVLAPSVVLLVAVVLAAWFSGIWPAMFASVLATAALDYFFTTPIHTLRIDVVHLPRLAVFTAIAGLFVGVSARRRSAERSLQKIRDDLDATVRERTAALRASEEQWKAVFENNPTMYFMVDPEGTVISVNPYGAEQLGYTVDDLIGQSVLTVFSPEDRNMVRATIAACLRDLGQVKTWEIRKLRRDGTALWVRETAKAMQRSQGGPIVLIACEDITSRKRAEHELEELAGRLIHAQEEERSRIGRELHDHISQMLGVLTIRMDQLRADEGTPPGVAAVLEALRHSTAEITSDIHSLSHRLHSSALDYLGLGAALQRLVKEFAARHEIDIELAHSDVPAPLPSDIALCLFRVTEESLTNIAKHSGSKRGRVDLRGDADGIHLSIEDAGAGFDAAALERKAGLGFVSMRERLRALRGTVRIDAAPGRGTRIEVLIPASSLTSISGDAGHHHVARST